MNQDRTSKSRLLEFCGYISLFGCIAAVVSNIIGIIVVENHNPISETISALAITKYAWIQDWGLNFFALGLIACAVGLFSWNLNGTTWKIGAFLLFLLGIDVVLIAEHNQYAGREGVGASIHIQCVYALGLLFALLTLLFATGLRKLGRNWYRFGIGITAFWVVTAPTFFIVPTNIDGAYERFVAMIMLTWVVAISWLLIRKGQGKLPAGL